MPVSCRRDDQCLQLVLKAPRRPLKAAFLAIGFAIVASTTGHGLNSQNLSLFLWLVPWIGFLWLLAFEACRCWGGVETVEIDPLGIVLRSRAGPFSYTRRLSRCQARFLVNWERGQDEDNQLERGVLAVEEGGRHTWFGAGLSFAEVEQVRGWLEEALSAPLHPREIGIS